MSATHIRLENPETGGVWDCPLDYEETARARGWVDTDKPLPGDVEEEAVLAEFDPSEHTVAEVNDYLAESDPAEAERVLVLERGGKNRSTIAAPEPTQPEGVAEHG